MQEDTFSFESLEKFLLGKMSEHGYSSITVTGYRYLCNSITTWLQANDYTGYCKKGGEKYLKTI